MRDGRNTRWSRIQEPENKFSTGLLKKHPEPAPDLLKALYQGSRYYCIAAKIVRDWGMRVGELSEAVPNTRVKAINYKSVLLNGSLPTLIKYDIK
jgi:hypothetical protein